MSKVTDLSAVGGEWLSTYQNLDSTHTLFGTPSLSFDGASRYWSKGTNDAGHQIQTGDFSIDGWARFEGLGAGYGTGIIVGKAGNLNQSYYVAVTGSTLNFQYSTSGSSGGLVVLNLGTLTPGVFFHFEVTRVGNTLYGFVNGVLVNSATLSGSFYNSTDPVCLGRINVPGFEYYWLGQIREVRITKGVGRHTATFAVPTAPPPADSTDPYYANTTALVRGDALVKHSSAAVSRPVGRVAGNALIYPATWKLKSSVGLVSDVYHGGRGRVRGTVAIVGTPSSTPAKRRVWLIRERDAQIVGERWSDPVTGAFSFDYVDPTQTYTVISFDYQHNFRAVVGDNLVPEFLP